MVLQVPGIVMFSLFIALLLSRDFPGRTFMRGLFFLPVIRQTAARLLFSTPNQTAGY